MWLMIQSSPFQSTLAVLWEWISDRMKGCILSFNICVMSSGFTSCISGEKDWGLVASITAIGRGMGCDTTAVDSEGDVGDWGASIELPSVLCADCERWVSKAQWDGMDAIGVVSLVGWSLIGSGTSDGVDDSFVGWGTTGLRQWSFYSSLSTWMKPWWLLFGWIT